MKPRENIAYAADMHLPSVQMQRIPLLLLVAVALLIGWVYWPTSYSMYEKWESSAGYSHGYIVLPVCLWLIWRKRSELAQTRVHPSALGFAVLAAAGLFWLLGTVGGVDTIKQFGLVFMVAGMVWAALGGSYAWALGFPLAYLLLAVPFGGGLIPYLMDWTADAVVWALRLTGVPVYQDGTNFVIPSGSWSVVEACAGSRYLISALVVGTLFSYLNFRSTRLRAIFFVACIIVPLLANWVRAYAIVMAAHLSNNQLGVSVGHLTLGWVIFGVSMLALFWGGSRWADREAVMASPVRPFTPTKTWASAPTAIMAIVAAFALAGLWKGVALYRSPTEAVPVTFSALPAQAGWAQSAEPDPSIRFNFAAANGELRQSFEKDGRRVSLVLAYYSQQKEGRELIHYLNGLQVGENWRSDGPMRSGLTTNDGERQFTGHAFRHPGGTVSYLSCYWVMGRWSCNEFIVKAWQAWSRLAYGRDDSARVVLYVNDGIGPAEDAAQMRTFWQQYGSAVEQQIEKAYGN